MGLAGQADAQAHDFDLTGTSGFAVITDDFAGFECTGFSPVPAGGELNSTDRIVGGLSDGDGAAGDTLLTCAVARAAGLSLLSILPFRRSRRIATSHA